jgi:hypothetical protein
MAQQPIDECFVRIRPDLGDLARIEALLKDLGDALTRYREHCELDDHERAERSES